MEMNLKSEPLLEIINALLRLHSEIPKLVSSSLEDLFPAWWWCLGRLWNLQEVEAS